MLMRRRTRLTILSVLLIAVLLVLIVLLRSKAPPEPARLLPGADAFVYLNLKWVRRLDHVIHVPPVTHDLEYDQFIRETGFQVERDLDEAAIAIHYTGSYAAQDGSPRTTEILSGRWNSTQVTDYLRRLSRSVEDYRGVDLFDVPFQGHNVRVAMLSVGTVAISNVDDVQVIKGIIDRSRKLASPFGGPALLRTYYPHVPFGSLAWAIVSSPSQLQNQRVGNLLLPLDYQQLLSGSVVVVSVRFLRSFHLRAEVSFPDEGKASQLAEKLTALLTIFRSLRPAASSGGADADVKKFFDSLKVASRNENVVLSAAATPDFIRKIFAPPSEPAPAQVSNQVPPPEPSAKPKLKPKKKPRH
jgi:hypothetical protein